MIHQNCPICWSGKEKKPLIAKEMLLGTRDNFNYLQCNDCWCAYLKNSINDFSKYYPDNYHVFSVDKLPFRKRYALEKVTEYNFYKKWLIGRFVWIIFKMIYGHLPETNIWWIWEAFRMLWWKRKDLKIIDIWCGKWVLLHQLSNLWFTDLSWVEPYANNEKSTIPIVKESIENFLSKKNNEKYDIVIMSHVLEHLFDHEKILEWLKKLLNKNWILIIAMPVLWKAFEKFWTNWYSFDAPRHVILHSEKSFLYLLKKFNLRIENKIYEEVPWNLFACELYTRDISFREMQNNKISVFELKKYKNYAKCLNNIKDWSSSLCFLIKNI